MFVSLVQGPLPRLVLVGMLLLSLQQTLFVDVRPWGVSVQVMLALAAACGVAGGPQRGALAGFVFGLLYDSRVGTPLGSSSFSMGMGGFTAGYVLSITIDPQWWLSALFVGIGTAVGETWSRWSARSSARSIRGPSAGTPWSPLSPQQRCWPAPCSSLGRWCVKVKKTDWTKVKAPVRRQPR